MALEELLVIVLIWLGIGAGIAAWIYTDTKVRKKAVEWDWVAIGFILSIIGAIVYIVAVNAEKKREYQYPPATKYENPKYDFEGEKHEAKSQPTQSQAEQTKTGTKEKAEIRQIEGIPRCRHCGAAISEHDWQCPKCGAKLKF
jgi:uncharacterized membrane protein YeaQ/YmgE (transglycosylase-associated protein family)